MSAGQVAQNVGRDWHRCGVARRASDEEIVEVAAHDERIILTFDKDFGDLFVNATSPQQVA